MKKEQKPSISALDRAFKRLGKRKIKSLFKKVSDMEAQWAKRAEENICLVRYQVGAYL